jgi:hypothetical protein
MKQKIREPRWFESQFGDLSDSASVARGLAIGAAMWVALAFIVWLSHRLA